LFSTRAFDSLTNKAEYIQQSLVVQKEAAIGAFFGISTVARSLFQKETTSLVDNAGAVAGVINCLATLPTGPPIIAIDCEGKDVGRYGTLAVIQLHDFRNNHTFIIDVVILGHATFYTCATNSTMTLRDIFELPLIRKIMWDFRNDQDAIFAGFAVELDGIDDAQILELATRCACDREK
jgi:exonuclease 3'-5' domain-containing protein 1